MTSQDLRIVIDKNIVSYIARKSPIADYYLPHLLGRRILISFQTWEEALFGAYLASWGERRMDDLGQQIEQYEVIWPNPTLVDLCARLRQMRQATGRRLDVTDAWVAATALYLDCPLASHDGDFEGIPGLQLIRNSSR